MDASQIAAVNAGQILFHFRIGGELTTHTLPRIRRTLLQQLNYCKEVEIDFSEVSIVDSKSVRAILTLRHEALRKNQKLHFVSRNEMFLQLLDSMSRAVSGPEPAI